MTEIRYELEADLGDDSWVGLNLEFDTTDTRNLDEVMDVRDRLVDKGYKTRVIEVRTTRTQLPI